MKRQRKESPCGLCEENQEWCLSLSDVERQSARSGFKIAGSYVSRIENGVVRNPSKDKLVGLAKGLGVAEEEVFAVARGKSLDEPNARELLAYFREFPRERQEDFIRIVEALHRKHSVKALNPRQNKSNKKSN